MTMQHPATKKKEETIRDDVRKIAMTQYPLTIEFLGTPKAGCTTLINGIRDEFNKEFHNSDTSFIGVTMEDVSKLSPYGVFSKESERKNQWVRVATAKKLLEFQEYRKRDCYDLACIDRGYVNSYFTDFLLSRTTRAMPRGIDLKSMGIIPPDLAIVLVCTPSESILRQKCEYTREQLCTYNVALKEFLYTQMPCRNFWIETTHLSQSETLSKVMKVIAREFS